MGRKRRARGDGAVFFSESKGCWVGRAIVGIQPNGKPKYKEVSAQTQGECLAKKRRAEEEAKAGRLSDAKPMTVAQYLDHWLENVSKPSVHLSTWDSYERCVRCHIKPYLGGVKLGQLRPVHVEQFISDLLKDGCSAGNARKVSAVLASAMAHAARVGVIPLNPVAPVAKPKPKEPPIVPFTPEEFRRIREAVAGHRLAALFAVAIGTGAREGELLALGREHIDLEAGTITIRRSLAPVKGGFVLKEPKSKRGFRVVELPQFCVDAMREHFKRLLVEGNVSAPVIFCTKKGDFIAKSWFIRQAWAPLLQRADVPYRKFHTIRHTHVSQLLAQGESVVDVARRVGDRPEVILRTYAHFLPGNASRLTSRLDALYG